MQEAPPAAGGAVCYALSPWLKAGLCRHQQVIAGNAKVIWSLFLDPEDIHVNTNYTFAKQKSVCGALVKKLSL